jgi:hypothetical protein
MQRLSESIAFLAAALAKAQTDTHPLRGCSASSVLEGENAQKPQGVSNSRPPLGYPLEQCRRKQFNPFNTILWKTQF